MKSRRTSTRIKGTSKRNVEFREILKKLFPAQREKIYAEYPYSKVTKINEQSLEDLGIRKKEIIGLKADIYMKDMGVVFELMGEQHYKPVAFGGNISEAEANFITQQRRDKIKRIIAVNSHMLKNEFILIEIPYNVKLPDTSKQVLSILSTAFVSEGNTLKLGEDGLELIGIEGESVWKKEKK
jgi:hypothetical protein